MEPEPRFRTAARRTVPPGAPASPQSTCHVREAFNLLRTQFSCIIIFEKPVLYSPGCEQSCCVRPQMNWSLPRTYTAEGGRASRPTPEWKPLKEFNETR